MLNKSPSPIRQKLAFAFISVTIAASVVLSGVSPALADVSRPGLSPQQIGVSMTSDPQTRMNISWTTIEPASNAMIRVWDWNRPESSAKSFAVTATTMPVSNSSILVDGVPVATKTFYSAKIDGLRANRTYKYRVGSEGNYSDVKSFTTAPDNNGKFTFVYFSDSQIKKTDAKDDSSAWQVNLERVEAFVPRAEFIYIAGDLTDTANNEGQWEGFFNQPGSGYHNAAFEGNLISDLPLAAAMGNHDSKNDGVAGMSSHYLWDSDVAGVPVSYAFDYGAARMIILNLENKYSRDNEALRNAQVEFLVKESAEARAAGKWTFVGFHKSLYSGANHMDDSDVIFNRKFWAPKFAENDIDVVLQGHDHVLSRGFIAANGYKVDITRKVGDRSYMAKDPDKAPLYYVGNTASSLKFYAPIMNNDYILEGDPVAPDFGYLDINSALPAGYTNAQGQLLNPGPCTNDDLEGQVDGFFRAPTFTAISVTKGSIEFKTYMTGYDPYNKTVVADTFLYDSLKVTR